MSLFKVLEARYRKRMLRWCMVRLQCALSHVHIQIFIIVRQQRWKLSGDLLCWIYSILWTERSEFITSRLSDVPPWRNPKRQLALDEMETAATHKVFEHILSAHLITNGSVRTCKQGCGSIHPIGLYCSPSRTLSAEYQQRRPTSLALLPSESLSRSNLSTFSTFGSWF